MRIIAQSQLVDGSPYRHLGYLAATHIVPQRVPYTLGLLLIGVGIAVYVISGIAASVRKGDGSHDAARWGKGCWVAKAGITAGVGGVALVAMGYISGRQELYDPERYTRSVTREACDWFIERTEWGTEPPARALADPVLAKMLVDAWKRPMRLATTQESGCIAPIVTSAGADGVFGTADDIVADYRELVREVAALRKSTTRAAAPR